MNSYFKFLYTLNDLFVYISEEKILNKLNKLNAKIVFKS